MEKNKRTIVISGINLFEGGPLSVYYDCLDAIYNTGLWKNNTIIAFVHKKELFERYKDFVTIIELPKSKKHYIFRIYYEYIFFNRYSKKKNIDVWLSLHDMTPRVNCRKLYTYCHNAIPFLKKDLTKLKYSWKVVMASFLYKYVYRFNIKAADALIVQQDWMRKSFFNMYPVSNIIVANPNLPQNKKFDDKSSSDRVVFIYASFPRFFKNFETILKAAEILERKGTYGFKIWLTLDGLENKYSSELKKRFSTLTSVEWLGKIKRDVLFKKYSESNCLIFPSLCESWGLPISEYKMTGKPMLLADLPYAREALGEYKNVSFFDPCNAELLAKKMEEIISKKMCYEGNPKKNISAPYCRNWLDLAYEILS